MSMSIFFIDNWKFIVSIHQNLRRKVGYHKDVYLNICGGTIVNKWQIISAAHCFVDKNSDRIILEEWAVLPKVSDLTKIDKFADPVTWKPPGVVHTYQN